ncbi:hypothetical protein ACWKWU_14260 [Chitinophaga lutea]
MRYIHANTAPARPLTGALPAERIAWGLMAILMYLGIPYLKKILTFVLMGLYDWFILPN